MASELLGPVEAAVLRAVGDGQARPHRIAERLDAGTRAIASAGMLYEALERCRRDGLLHAERDRRGRAFAVTPAGRRRLRERREFGRRVARLLTARDD